MIKTALLIGAGGFAGTVLRYFTQLISYKFLSISFPYGTFAVNIIGCVLIGIFYAAFDRGSIASSEIRLFLTVGLCGGFTTFSAFSFETLELMKTGQPAWAFLYAAASVLLGLAAVLGGYFVTKVF